MAARAALASSLSRLFTRSPAANLIPCRGLAGGGDHHGPPRINIWEDPMSPSKWKEEHLFWSFILQLKRESCAGNCSLARSKQLPNKSQLQYLEFHRGFANTRIIPNKFVLASLSGWGLLIYGGLKAFGGKKEKKEEVIAAAAH